jgi:hypothetical protein
LSDKKVSSVIWIATALAAVSEAAADVDICILIEENVANKENQKPIE